jgi:hypothetical protein
MRLWRIGFRHFLPENDEKKILKILLILSKKAFK